MTQTQSSTTQTNLYGFQQDGIKFLTHYGGGFLWDDPGLGKTRQAIVAAKVLGGPVLVVCPNSLKSWWRQEILTMFPEDRVLTSGVGGRFGSKRYPMDLLEMAREPGFPWWTIVHYAGVRVNEDELKTIRWRTVIADEVHYIKNRKARRTAALWRATPAGAHRIGLTATPFGQNPSDLWSQLRWMVPEVKELRSFWKFYNTFVDYEFEHKPSGAKYRRVKGGKNLKLLARLMSGYGIRRTKKEVASQLPSITDTLMPLYIGGTQLSTYRLMKKKQAVEIEFPNADFSNPDDIADHTLRLVIPNALARMTRLEQWLSHPWTFDKNVMGAKLLWIKEWAEGYTKPAVIATRFKASAHRVCAELGEAAGTSAITGDISVTARSGIIERWQRGEFQFLVGTIDTIGIGLSLERAHATICYDQLHSTIKMEQLRHRIHRITSKHPVEVIYLCVRGTTNDIVLQAFQDRWNQVQIVRRFLQYLQEQEAISNGSGISTSS